MITNQPFRVSGGRLALGIILAAVLGVLTPLLLTLEACFLLPVLALNGVLMVFFFGYAGQLATWLYMTVQLGATAALLNTTFMWMTMAAGTFPAIFALRGIIMKKPFFEQMRWDVGVYIAGLVAAVVIASMTYGGNLIGRTVDAVTEQFRQMPDFWFRPFVDAINQAFSTGELQGAKSLDMAEYRAKLLAVLQVVGETYERMLPGTLLGGAALSGVLSALWGNWLMARRGLATNESYIGLNQWFLPRWLSLELMLLWLIAYIVSGTEEYASGETVYLAAFAMVQLAFMIQGLASIDRFALKRGMSGGGRRFLTTLGFIFGLLFRMFNTFLFLVGIASALFGSHGAIMQRIDDDDEDNS